MTAGLLLLSALLNAAPSLDLSVVRVADSRPVDAISFRARTSSESALASPEALVVRVEPPIGPWRVTIHTANDTGASTGGGRGLRRTDDPRSGIDLLWRGADSLAALASPAPREAWKLVHDPVESSWASIASSPDVLVAAADRDTEPRLRYLGFAAAPDRIRPGTYRTRILVDLLCFGAPEEPHEGWAPIGSLGQKSPDGIRIEGDAISLSAGFRRDLRSVRFEYRASSSDSWTLCATTLWSDPNPDTRPPHWGILWDVSHLADGPYQLRAVATAKDGRVDPDPGFLRILKTSTDSVIHGVSSGTEGRFTQRQWCGDEGGETIALFDGTTIRITPDVFRRGDSGAWIRATIFRVPPSDLGPLLRFYREIGGFRRFEREDGLHTFPHPITIEIPYTTEGLSLPEDRLVIHWFDRATLTWIPLKDSRVDTERRVVVATTDHFTDFAVIARSQAVDLKAAIVYPNPYVPFDGRDENGRPFVAGDLSTGIIFDGLTPGSFVRIFTVAGREVIQLTGIRFDGRLQWDAKASDGRDAASGVYFAVIKAPSGEAATRKFMIIR